MKRIKSGDSVKIIAGAQKGTTAEVVKVAGNKVYLKDLGNRERHYRATAYNQGGKRDIQTSFDISNVALVVDDKPVKVAYKVTDDKKVRVVRSNGKEIK